MRKFFTVFLLLLVQVIPVGVSSSIAATASSDNIIWASKDSQGNAKVHLYVFWSKTCPHCHEALGYLKKAQKQNPWVKVHLKEITNNKKNMDDYNRMASSLGEPADVVPAFFFCEMMYAGYNGNSTGEWIIDTMKSCGKQQAKVVLP